MSNITEVKVAVDGCRASLTFTSESGLNVSSRETLARLAHGVETLAGNPAVRLTVVRAEGKVFLAGADIKEMSGFDADRAREFSVFGNRTMDSLALLPSITVAAIQGAALGGGCEIALACDFRIAVKSAKIGLPETTLGLIPGWGGTKRALRLLGPSRARRLIFGGAMLSAQDALEIGLIDELGDFETAVKKARSLADLPQKPRLQFVRPRRPLLERLMSRGVSAQAIAAEIEERLLPRIEFR